MSLAVWINGELRNDNIRAVDISIEKVLGEPWTCSLESLSLSGDLQVITGDGVARQFELDRIPANVPGLVLGVSTPLTVGLYGIDLSGFDYYWEVGTVNIYVDDLGITLPNNSTITADLGTWYPSVGQPLQIKLSHAVSYEVEGDGSTQVFLLPQTANEITSLVANDFIPQTYGIWGVDSGKQWYLDLATNELKQEPLDPPLAIGETLDIGYEYWVTVFGGIIRSVVRVKPGGASDDVLTCNVSATDYNHILERRLTGENEFTGLTDNAILTAIWTDSLTDEGIALNLGAAVDIDSFRVSYDTVAGALTELSKLSGKRFWIDADKVLHYKTTATTPAPFDVPSAATNISELKATETDEDYVNVVIVKSGQTIRPEQVEEFDGDGASTSFETAYPLASEPEIRVNGVLNTVGIAGVDTGRDWYWAVGSREIRQDAEGVPITGTIEVKYAGIESIYLESKNVAEIAARAAKEGDSSGRYEKLFEIDRLLSRADAQAVADGILAARDEIPLKVVYTTTDYHEIEAKNLQPGQQQSMLLDGWAAQQIDYVVRSVSMRSLGVPDSRDWQFTYDVELFHGSLTTTLFQWFRELAGAGGGGAGGTQPDSETEQFHFMLAGCDVVPAGTDISPHRPVAHRAGTIYSVSSDCKTAPNTADLVFNILRSNDGGTVYESIFPTGSATHPQDTNGPVFWYSFNPDALIVKGSKFRVDVVTGGNAEGWALKLSAKRTAGRVGALEADGSQASGITGKDESTELIATIL